MGERTWLLFKDQWTAGLCFNLCSNLCSKLSNQWFPVRATCTITHLCPVHCQAGYLSAIRVFVGHICDQWPCTVNILIVLDITLAPNLYFPILFQHGAAITGNNVITVSMEIIAPATLFIGIWHQIWTRSALINRSNTGFILDIYWWNETLFVGWTDLTVYTHKLQHKQQ